jgi:putative solute:sodium symporter small subunit
MRKCFPAFGCRRKIYKHGVRNSFHSQPHNVSGFGCRFVGSAVQLLVYALKIGDFMKEDTAGQAYWKATLGLLAKILVIWFLVSFGAGILFAEFLNRFHLGGYPLGFWFAQQGSIYVFIALIFYYAKKMGDIDRQFDVHEE